MSLILTEGQQKALAAIEGLKQTHPNGGGVVVISGYAGTGKTTLLKELAARREGLFVLTPTGKAAVRVRETAGCDAQTIHRWQYIPRKNEETGEIHFDYRNREELQLPPEQTLVVDEASMVTEKVWQDLYFFCKLLGLNVVLIGDGFQLPPVETDPRKAAFSVFADSFAADAKVQLTEVLRQALDSPIIRVSMDLRTLRDPAMSLMELPSIIDSKLDQTLESVVKSGGMVLCHRNVTRHAMNAKARALLKLPDDEVRVGERLMVTRNNYKLNVFNGEVFEVESLTAKTPEVVVNDRRKNKAIYMTFQEVDFVDIADGGVISVEEVYGKSEGMDTDYIKNASVREMQRKYPGAPKDRVPPHVHAAFGYAMTYHKAQGSESREALVIVEPTVRLESVEGKRMLYTALTRAKEKVFLYWP